MSRRKGRGIRKPRSPFAIGAIVIAVIALLTYLGFTRHIPFTSRGFELKAAFMDANRMRANSPVRIAGVDVGKVASVQPASPGSRAVLVTMHIQENGLPIHADATAKIRPRIFLEGNFYVDLRPGTPGSPDLQSGATLSADHTASPVQFDQVLRILRSDVRANLTRTLIELGATEKAGGAAALNRALRYEPDAFRYAAIASDALLGRRPDDLGDLIRDQGTVAGAIDAFPPQLRSLIGDFNVTAAALADRQAALRGAIGELPRTLGQALVTFSALNRSFPRVRTFAAVARRPVRLTGPAARALTPLAAQLRGLVTPAELRGLASDLQASIPALAQLSRRAVPLLGQTRAAASCAATVMVPYASQTVPDANYPARGPVFEEAAQFLPGLAGESRSFDSNGEWFKVLGAGGPDTVSLGGGLHSVGSPPLLGVNPPPAQSVPPLEPRVPCETQQRPDLRTQVLAPPAASQPSGPAVAARTAKAQAVAVALERRILAASGHGDVKVLDRDATLADLEQAADRLGHAAQLQGFRSGLLGRKP